MYQLKQPLLDQKVDQWRSLCRNVGAAGDVSPRIFAVGVNAGEPGDQPPPQQAKTRLVVAGNARVGVSTGERALGRRIDCALQTAKLFVVGEPQRASLAVVEIELFEGEGEQGQRVAGASGSMSTSSCCVRIDSMASLRPASSNRRAGPSITSR